MGLTHRPRDVVGGRCDLCLPVPWRSGAVERSAKSTLAAEGYATLEGTEITHVSASCSPMPTEAFKPKKPLKDIDDLSLKRPGEVYSDSKGRVAH
eukprot:6410399-Pyramimonas_sp.AAC.1